MQPQMSVRVVAAVIERDQRLLVCQRPEHKRHGGLWEFPGGKVEPGESDLSAVSRELREELDLAVLHVGAVEFSRHDPGSHFIIDFLPVRTEGEPKCLEHASLAWVALEGLLKLPLAPSDLEYVRARVSQLDTGRSG